MTGYYPQTLYQTRTAANDFDMSYRLALWMRKRFLIKWLQVAKLLFPHLGFIMGRYYETDIQAAQIELDRVSKAIEAEDRPATDEITDEMIQRAREYPIDKLIEFTKGKTIAFCHDDKTPSLSLDKRRNKAHCFVCNKDFDSIGVLRERDKLSFHDSVRRLQ